jgi:hypothetical protein
MSRGSSWTTSPTRASGCLGTSRGSSSTTSPRAARRRLLRLCRASGCLGTLRDSSLTTLPRAGSYAARLGASARHVARLAAPHRLLSLRRASGCLGTSCGSSRRSSSTTSPMPRVRVPRHVTPLTADYFAYAACLGASAHRAARHTARR